MCGFCGVCYGGGVVMLMVVMKVVGGGVGVGVCVGAICAWMVVVVVH